MTKFIIVRHGESLGNEAGAFLGHTDLDLSATGKKQAQLTGEFLADKQIDVIYASDLLRAYNTAKPTADIKSIKIIKDENLREVFAGDWENVKFDTLCTAYKDDYVKWRNDIGNAGCTNGETVKHLSERICAEMEKIAAENDGKTVMIATHATPIRAMVTKWSGYSFDDMKSIPWVKNASLTYAEYENGVFTITSADNTSHLKDIVTQLPHNV